MTSAAVDEAGNHAGLISTPIFLSGYPKSGTTLLLSLLDGHPALNVFPRETLFFTHALPELRADPSSGLDRFVDRIFKEVLFGLENVLDDHVGADRYAAELRREWEATGFDISRFLEIAVETYGSLISTSKRPYWVEKTPHTELFFEIVRSWYPHSKMIHCLRDPRANYAAIRTWNEREGRPTSIPRFVSHWKKSWQAVERARLALPVLVLKYEDLVEDTRGSMEAVCEFLGIDFDDVLLRPTLEGRPFGGNSMYQKDFSGVSRDSTDRWRSILTEEQIGEIQGLASREMAAMKYISGSESISTLRSLRSSAALHAYQLYDRLPESWRLSFRYLRARLTGVGAK